MLDPSSGAPQYPPDAQDTSLTYPLAGYSSVPLRTDGYSGARLNAAGNGYDYGTPGAQGVQTLMDTGTKMIQ